MERDVFSKIAEILANIRSHLNGLTEATDQQTLLREASERLGSIEESIRNLAELIPSAIEEIKDGKITPGEISETTELLSEVESAFAKFLSKLENIHHADSKALETLKMVSLQIKASESMISKGQNIKIKR